MGGEGKGVSTARPKYARFARNRKHAFFAWYALNCMSAEFFVSSFLCRKKGTTPQHLISGRGTISYHFQLVPS